jgi:LemA protein
MLLFLVLPLVVWTLLYNSLVGKEERVLEAWAQVETSYQRRSDLVPALVETVSRYLRHERETLERVTEERSEGLSGLQAMTEDLVQAQQRSAELLREHAGQPPEDEEALLALSQAQAQVGAQMRRFFGLTESYPQLRSADQFLRLQAQLEGTENRINVARSRFNESVRDFNRSIRALPGSLVAAAGDFRRKAYFRADEESHQVPVLGY